MLLSVWSRCLACRHWSLLEYSREMVTGIEWDCTYCGIVNALTLLQLEQIRRDIEAGVMYAIRE